MKAAIAIFSFKRLDTLQKTLCALEQCHGFPGGPIQIFSDAPRKGRKDEEAAVESVRVFLRKWANQHGATLHEAPENRGLRNSITSGVTEILKQHERVIVLEDDIITSPWFLKFMHDSLEAYEHCEHVYTISGYFIPTKAKLPPVGLLKAPACWGWATWKDKWQHYSDDAAGMLKRIEPDAHEFDVNGTYAYLESLKKNALGEQNTWAVRWYASMFLRGGYTLYPGQSLTRNIGFDEAGTNCQVNSVGERFLKQPIKQSEIPVQRYNGEPLNTDPAFLDALEAFYRWQKHQWTKPTIKQRIRARIKKHFHIG